MGLNENPVYSTGRPIRTIWAVFDTSGSGTLTSSSGSGDFSFVRNGTGDITITLTVPFVTLLGVHTTAGSDSATNEYVANTVVANTDRSTQRIIVNDDAGTAADVTQLFVCISGMDDPG